MENLFPIHNHIGSWQASYFISQSPDPVLYIQLIFWVSLCNMLANHIMRLLFISSIHKIITEYMQLFAPPQITHPCIRLFVIWSSFLLMMQCSTTGYFTILENKEANYFFSFLWGRIPRNGHSHMWTCTAIGSPIWSWFFLNPKNLERTEILKIKDLKKNEERF